MMDRRTFIFASTAGLGWPRASRAGTIAPDADGVVEQVIAGDHVILSDTRRVKLAGIEAPRPAQGEQVAQPLFATARDHLAQLVTNQTISLRDVGFDRFGRIRAHAFVGDQWVQGKMLKAGMARVRTWPDDQNRAAEMLALEQDARDNKRSLWANPFYALRTPETVSTSIGSFQIIEGMVVDAAQTRSMTYLNFGTDWRTDFTAQADNKTKRAFAKSGINLAGLSGAQVRVRGLIRSYNGPQIWLTHPAQLQVIA